MNYINQAYEHYSKAFLRVKIRSTNYHLNNRKQCFYLFMKDFLLTQNGMSSGKKIFMNYKMSIFCDFENKIFIHSSKIK